MTNKNTIRIILFSDHSLGRWRHAAQAEWLTVLIQPVLERQERKAKKIFLSYLKNLPPIHLS